MRAQWIIALIALAGWIAPAQAVDIEARVASPTAYVFRGYTIIDDRPMVQPEVAVSQSFDVGEITLSPYAGVWANMVSGEWLEEVDYLAGVEVSAGKFTLDAGLTLYTSPADSFEDLYELGIVLSYEHWLQPHMGVHRELNGNKGTYIELGIEPSIDLPLSAGDWSVAFPVKLGMGLDDYYTESDGGNAMLGYVSGGAVLSIPLHEHVTLDLGVEYVHFLADSTRDERDGLVVGTIGLKFSL